MNIKKLIYFAIQEDLQGGDITTDTLNTNYNQKATIIAKKAGIICGVKVAKEVFTQIDLSLKITILKNDGNKIKPNDIILEIEGKASSILKGERVALNFLQRLSGIATKTNLYASKLKYAKVYDTRKTTPLLREIEKYAVKIGGGENHRMGLYDEILIKENHITAGGGISNVLKIFNRKFPNKKREIEVENIRELKEALSEKSEIILLDNMTPGEVKECLAIIEQENYKPIIEVSGGISLDNILRYDFEGVDRVSIGELTHSVRSLDLSLRF